MKSVTGLALAFAIGFGCRYLMIPVPAPPVLTGALLVVAMTLGFILVDKVMAHRSERTLPPTGNGP